MAAMTRMTKQRKIILEELQSVNTHPTADEVYQMVRARLPYISLGTVYRNLDMLAEAGEILLLESAGRQKRFDGCTKPHHHVRCTQCGRVGDVFTHIDLDLPEKLDIAPGFTVTSVRVEFEGICDKCKN